jgi:hypothetical protein
MVWLAACGRGDGPDEMVGAYPVKLGTTGLTVRVLDPMRIAESPDGVSLLTLRATFRSPTRLSVRALPHSSGLQFDRHLTSACGVALRYRVESTAGGSGGTEATALGEARTKDRNWSVECHAQSESDDPEAECVAIMASLCAP